MFSFFRRRHFEALASAKAKTEALASAKAKICISVTANLEHLAAERRQGLFLDNSGNVDGIQWNSACQNFMERVVLPLLTDREAKAVVDAGLSSVATELVELPVRLECQRVGQYPARRPIVWPRSKLELVEPDHFLKISKISMPVNCFAESVVQRGLIIRPEPLQKILYGIKTWEMRSRRINIRGTVALIAKGTKEIHGVAEIVDCIGPMSFDELSVNEAMHAVSTDRLGMLINADYRYAWVLAGIRSLPNPIPYIHVGGVQFVTLDAVATEELRLAMANLVR